MYIAYAAASYSLPEASFQPAARMDRLVPQKQLVLPVQVVDLPWSGEFEVGYTSLCLLHIQHTGCKQGA